MIWVCPPLCLREDEAEQIVELLERAIMLSQDAGK
jgi:hypothetical protein